MFHVMAFIRGAKRQILSCFPAKTEKPAASKPVKRRRTARVGTFRVQILEHDIPLHGRCEIAPVNLLRSNSFNGSSWIAFFTSRLRRFNLCNHLTQPAN